MGDLVAHLNSDNSELPGFLDYIVAAGLRTTWLGAAEVYYVLLASDTKSKQDELQIIWEGSLFRGPLCRMEDYLSVKEDGITLPVMVDMMRFSNKTWQYSFDGGHEYVDEQKLIKLGAAYWPN